MYRDIEEYAERRQETCIETDWPTIGHSFLRGVLDKKYLYFLRTREEQPLRRAHRIGGLTGFIVAAR